MKDYEIYSEGICHMSVCSALPAAELEGRIRAERPSGTKHGWMLSAEPTFRGGEPNPCPCNRNPGTHMHYLFVC